MARLEYANCADYDVAGIPFLAHSPFHVAEVGEISSGLANAGAQLQVAVGTKAGDQR
jgi:hypothetical protein